MNTFLDDVAKIITTSHKELDQIKIIVPSIRSITFLKEALKKQIQVPKISPEIISIEVFINDLSDLKTITKIDLLYSFYEVYLMHTPKEKQDTMNQFFNWAPSVLQEFNEVDAQLIDSNKLFAFMGAVDEIEAWSSSEKESIRSNHLNFQSELPVLYKKLYEYLLLKQKGYAGMQLREAVRNLGFYTESKLLHHYFVGFNALTKAEETIIQELLVTEKAEILWDLDQSFYDDPYQGAGHFIRRYLKSWNSLKKEKTNIFSNIFFDTKEIEIIRVSKNITQAKIAVQIATELNKKNPNSSSVIVLGDENLLHPTLSALHQNVSDWNITMGYPLAKTMLSSFYYNLFELLQNYSEAGHSIHEVKAILEVASTGLVLEDNGESLADTIALFQKSNRDYIPVETLINFGGELSDLLFSPFSSVNTFLERIQKITIAFKTFYSSSDKESLYAHYCDRFLILWEDLSEQHEDKKLMTTLEDVKMVFQLMVQQETLDFSGDALSKLQIMGVLETRLLDYDNVIITNVNEGILPFGKTPFSVIPFDVRRKFEMNTFIEQDHLYAYHFFRLLQRAKNIYLLYNATPEGLFSGEKSRFLVQLEYFKSPKHKLSFKQIDQPLTVQKTSLKEAVKTSAVLKQLDEIAIQGFSPSSIGQYIRNPYLFYEQRMLKIKPLEANENDLSAQDKGTIMHEVLELVYTPFLNKKLSSQDYDKMLLTLPKLLEKTFNSVYKNNSQRTGKNHIIFNVMEKILTSFLIEEKSQIAKGRDLKILGLEYRFSKPIWVKGLEKEIIFKGSIDRIDSLDGVIRFVDYKTGNVTGSDLSFRHWDELISDPKKSPLFQVLLYAYAIKDEFKEDKVWAGVIPLKNFENNFIAASITENSRTKTLIEMNESILLNFEKELFALINEIFDPNIPFVFKI